MLHIRSKKEASHSSYSVCVCVCQGVWCGGGSEEEKPALPLRYLGYHLVQRPGSFYPALMAMPTSFSLYLCTVPNVPQDIFWPRESVELTCVHEYVWIDHQPQMTLKLLPLRQGTF